MKNLLTILFIFISLHVTSQGVSEVSFTNDNETQVINYVLQYQDNGWQDIKTIKKGEDYSFEIPFKPGLYRMLVHQKSSDYYTRIVRLKADEMTVRVEVNSQIILHVTSPVRQEVKIFLYDYTARLIAEKEVGLNEDENTIYLPKPATGMYVLNIIGSESIHSKIFVP